MGLTFVRAEIANVSTPADTRSVEMMVDSGAIFSIVPATLLAELGIEPITEETFFLADGKTVVRKKGGAVFSYQGKKGVADVLFGEEGDSNLLGATTLESLGLSLDPFRRELSPMTLPLGGFRPSAD